MLSIGGDGSVEVDENSKQNRFKPVVKFLGPFYLKPGETRKHSYKMPNYVGSVKTMVVAAYKGSYGSTSKATQVKKPLMVLATLPRVLGPKEEISLPITVFAMDDKIKKVKVMVTGNELIQAVGKSSSELTFTQTGDQLAFFKMRVGETIGKGSVKIVVTSGEEKAIYFVDVNIRTPNPPVVDVASNAIAGGGSWRSSLKKVGLEGTNEAIVEVSAMPPFNISKRLNYLIKYPHGCIEQTTSSVFPQLYLSDVVQMPKEKKEQITRNVKNGIARLTLFQCADGGLAYWPGGYASNEWGTNYAGNFLLEAKRAGYTVPAELMNNWLKYQKKKANGWAAGDKISELTQANRLYLLALAGEPQLGARPGGGPLLGAQCRGMPLFLRPTRLAGPRLVVYRQPRHPGARRHRRLPGSPADGSAGASPCRISGAARAN
ncbi:MAG: hypothetical protein IH948_02920 [Bacteroidetes bacterium]|nr:hypothetical protein [Bacteroidota bacterium]